ncbi:membrane-targeted effector domain-containing toxin [Pseudomonas sp.]|uniref:membrane-targeted effector domain-containing toxin n=1 Tax=Pseudomonas sp. TaxID=306 RepID=UPI0026171EAB|nr:membrane-targeted effector domain-containing toxin [Pseudomonas sp.]
MISALANLRIRRDVSSLENTLPPQPRLAPQQASASTLPTVQGIAPVSAVRPDLLSGLQITDQRLLLNQYQALNRNIQALLLRQPTLGSVIEQQLARSFSATPAVDASSLYVHRYYTDEQGQRTLVSTQSITEALFDALRKLNTAVEPPSPTRPGVTEVGFYTTAEPSESDQQLSADSSLLTMAQAIENDLPERFTQFWTQPRPGEVNPTSHQDQLLGIHREMLSTLAALRVEDGTLSPAARTLIDKAIEYPTLAARESAMQDRERPGVYPLKLNLPMPSGTLLAGAFMITGSDGSSAARPYDKPETDRTLHPAEQSGLTVLYTPREGYETFDSPAQAFEKLGQRLRVDPQAAEQLKQTLPLPLQHSLGSNWSNDLSQHLAPVTADVIASGVPQLLQLHRSRLSKQLQALYEPENTVQHDDPWRAPQVMADLQQAADLSLHFDGTNALWARTQSLQDRLSNVDGRQALNQQLEDRKNWQYLAQQLNQAYHRLPEQAPARDVAASLQNTPMNIASGSTQYQAYILEPDLPATVEAFITENGLALPKTRRELLSLAETAALKARQHPFGNFGGGLSWPIPLDISQQQALRTAASAHANLGAHSSQAGPERDVLGYLNSGLSLSHEALQDPIKALESLVSSPEGQALGLALQSKLNGIHTDSSVNHYTLAALQLTLDPESITAPHRNRVAGFDLARESLWGEPASTVTQELRQHLIDTGRASPALAKAATHLLLMRTAPQYLVRDMPDNVRQGTQAWANLCLAVAAIEAKAAGSAANMTFAEVMVKAAALPPAPAAAQTAALVDWGVSNNILQAKGDELYSQDDLDRARAAFSNQQEKLKEGSALMDTVMPDRATMALDLLMDEFGKDVDFDEKIFTRLSDTLPPKPGRPYSMREIVMEQVVMDHRWSIKIGTQPVDLATFVAFTKRPQFNIQTAFDAAFSEAVANFKKVKYLSVVNALNNLAPEHKKNLSFGKISYYLEKSYKKNPVPFMSPTLFHTSPRILVSAENNGKVCDYAFDTKKGVIEPLGSPKIPRVPTPAPGEIIKYEEFFPDIKLKKLVEGMQTFAHFLGGGPVLNWFDASDTKRHPLDAEQPGTATQPYMFTHHRTHYLAESIVKALDLDNPAIRKAAAGATSSERDNDRLDTLRDWFLDLIPLRSAIVNFNKGDYSEAVNDLAFDVFGFVTAGAGAAAKAANVLKTSASAASKAVKVTRIMVPSLAKELNPFNGADGMIIGAGKVAFEAAGAAKNGLRSLKGTVALGELSAAGKRFEAAATGRINVGKRALNGNAIKHNDQWYAFDANSQRPYGPPLVAFNPAHTLMPPSPDINAKARLNARAVDRAHPYKKPYHATRQGDGRAVPIVPKTDHLPPPAEEYVDFIKGAPSETHFTPSRRQATQGRFELEMNRSLAAPEPPRPALPEMEPFEPISQVIEKALDSSNIVIFGENHLSLASFRTLQENIAAFKRKNVKVIGIEGVIYDNKMQLKDAGMGATGPNHRPDDPNLNLQTLIATFKANGIEVVPLDHVYLTRHRHERVAYTSQSPAARNLQRLKEMNYYAARELQRHAHKGKVIALVGRQHINTTQGVRGLAEATGGVGIGIYERAGIKVGYGTQSTDLRPGPKGELKTHEDITGDLQIFTGE